MKQEILNLVETNPKKYSVMIKKRPDMLQWVDENTLTKSDYLPARIYSAVYGVSDVCQNGNTKQFKRWGDGFIGCGPTNVCKCARDAMIQKSAQANRSKTDEEQRAINEVRKATMLERYGVEYNSQRQEVLEKLQAPKVTGYALDKLSDKKWLTEQYVNLYRSVSEIANELGVDNTTVKSYLDKNGITTRAYTNYR